MFSNQESDVSLNGPCRALDSIRGDTVENRFLVGTCAVNNNNNFNSSHTALSKYGEGTTTTPTAKNRLAVLRFHSDSNELIIESEFDHFTGAVHTLCCHPTDPSLVITTTEKQGNAATLWKLPASPSARDGYHRQSDDPSESESEMYSSSRSTNHSSSAYKDNNNAADQGELERIATLQHPDDEDSENTCPSLITQVAWRAGGDDSSGDVLTIDSVGNLTQWDATFGAADPVKRISMATKQENSHVKHSAVTQPRVKWDPHSNSGDTLAVSYGTNVHILDWRIDTSIPSGTVEILKNCHRYGVTDIDYNPNKPYVMATAGKDGLLKFWDLRSMKQYPLLTARGGHSHWVCNVKYNPFHDQLVLSSGTDAVVNLWRFSTISSAPVLAYEDDDDFGGDNPAIATGSSKNTNNAVGLSSSESSSAPNARVGAHEHGDSVYAAAWGAADAWIYLTVGYDGKAILNHVPSKEKYKILL